MFESGCQSEAAIIIIISIFKQLNDCVIQNMLLMRIITLSFEPLGRSFGVMFIPVLDKMIISFR